MQEYCSQLQLVIDNPNPRLQVLLGIEDHIKEKQRNPNHYIIIMINANENMWKNGRSNLREFIQSTGLVDAHNTSHPLLSPTPTFANGSNQIDYCLVSPRLIPFIVKAGILPLNFVVIGDHRTLFIDIAVEDILNGENHTMTEPTPRKLRLSNEKATN